MNMFASFAILTQDMLETREIENLLQAIVHLLKEIFLHERAKNKILFPDPVQRLSVES